MRYRKRISLGKGLRLNLSKSGVSLTGGVPGLSVNAGRSGTFLNTGLPGSGLYDRKRIGGGKRGGSSSGRRNRGTGASGDSGTGGSPSEPQGGISLKISVDGRGAPVFTYASGPHSGQRIDNPQLLRRLRRESGIRKTLQKLYRDTVAEFTRELDTWRGFHREAPDIPDRAHWLELRRSLKPRRYDPLPYPAAEPAAEDVLPELRAAARREIRGLLPWVVRRKRREYVAAQLPRELERRRQDYRAARAEHDAAEAERAQRLNRTYQRDFDEQAARIDALLGGDAAVIEDDAGQLLEALALPGDCAVDFEFDAARGCMHLDVDLPEMSDLPQKTARILASGKLSIKDMPQKQRRRLYRDMATGLSLNLAAQMCTLSPAVQSVLVSGYTQQTDPATGRSRDVYIISAGIDRGHLQGIRLAEADPTAVITSLPEHRLKSMSDATLREIDPLDGNTCAGVHKEA